MKSTKVTCVEMILAFSRKEDIKNLYTAPNAREVRMADFSGLGRVWNEGRGFLQLADFTEKGVLVLNSLLLNKHELGALKAELTVPYMVVEYGYPDYYDKSLTSEFILTNRKIESHGC